jgi:hypothetical protein
MRPRDPARCWDTGRDDPGSSPEALERGNAGIEAHFWRMGGLASSASRCSLNICRAELIRIRTIGCDIRIQERCDGASGYG